MPDRSVPSAVPLQYATPQDAWQSWVTRGLVLLTLYPLLMPTALYGTWVAAWVSLGHPPRPSLDDPTQISAIASGLYNATLCVFMLFPAALVLGATGVTANYVIAVANRRPQRRPLLALALYAAAWAGTIALMHGDPGGVGNWFID